MGSSQARALISTMLSEGKRARSPASGLVIQAIHPFVIEPLPPLRDVLARHAKEH